MKKKINEKISTTDSSVYLYAYSIETVCNDNGYNDKLGVIHILGSVYSDYTSRMFWRLFLVLLEKIISIFIRNVFTFYIYNLKLTCYLIIWV